MPPLPERQPAAQREEEAHRGLRSPDDATAITEQTQRVRMHLCKETAATPVPSTGARSLQAKGSGRGGGERETLEPSQQKERKHEKHLEAFYFESK